MFKILITGRNFGAVSKDDYNYFLDRGYEILPNPCAGRVPSEDELCEMIVDADAILIGNDRITARVMDHAKHLKVINKEITHMPSTLIHNISFLIKSISSLLIPNL